MARKRKKDQQKLGKPAKKKPADDNVTGSDGLVNSLVNKLTSFVTGRGRYVVSNRGRMRILGSVRLTNGSGC
jgi:hypothetical protein